MIAAAKALIARHWPVLRLRTILFGTLLFVAALPGFGAIFLRVYENALVRRTEAELVAQSAALTASAAVLWGNKPAATGGDAGRDVEEPEEGRRFDEPYSLPVEHLFDGVSYKDQLTEIDLRSSPILPPRARPAPAKAPPEPDALAVAEQFQPALQETKLTTLSSLILLDRNGTVLVGPDKGKSLAGLPEVKSALAGKAATVMRENESYSARYSFEWLSRASNIRLHHARPVRVNGQVVGALLVSRSPRALFRGIYEDRGKIALGVVTIFMMLVGLSAILSRAIVRPIENLSRATKSLASGRHAEPGRPSLQVVEIRDLFDDFGQMAERIEKRSRYLRDFAASVSHEFKTPLAGISGAIELLQDHAADMAPADRERFLANMAADAERLSRLVKRLMEQAQADVQAGHGDAPADPRPILAAVADGFRSDRFAVTLTMPRAVPKLMIDSRVLEAVLNSFAENAQQAGATALDLKLTAKADGAVIDLIDNGPGIPEGDRARVFDPFFTSKREQGGTGLGLSIARSLVEGTGGTIELMCSAQGAHFRISCPVG